LFIEFVYFIHFLKKNTSDTKNLVTEHDN